MIKNLLLIVFFIFNFNYLFPQISPKDNQSIFDSLTKTFFLQLKDSINISYKTGDTAFIATQATITDNYFFNRINNKLSNLHLLRKSNSNDKGDIQLFIGNFGVNYQNSENCYDCLIRSISISLIAFVKNKTNSNESMIKFNRIYCDTIDRSIIGALENTDYDFCKSSIPERNDSFWHQYFEPIFFTVISAVCVTTFF